MIQQTLIVIELAVPQTAYQGINTNNYTEAWHWTLKSQFIPPPEKRRIDKFLQILIDEVEPCYQTTSDRVDGGFEEQTLNLCQLVSKRLADSYTKQLLATLGMHIFSFAGHVSTILCKYIHPLLHS
jgi:hypothetical protein